MKNIKQPLLFLSFFILLGLNACNEESDPEECNFSSRFSCSASSYSIIDAKTFENLIGRDGKLIHPDSIIIINTRGDTMYHEISYHTSGWRSITKFSAFQELHCFNQCTLDSAFTRTYYMHLGNNDVDTLEVYFAERTEEPTTFYNGLSGEYPDHMPSDFSPATGFLLRKIID